MTTGKLAAWGPSSRGATRKRRVAREAGRPRQSVKERRTTEYSANDSFPDQTHAAVSACIVLSEVETSNEKEFMVKPHG